MSRLASPRPGGGYRWQVASRVLAAAAGGYALSALATSVLAFALPRLAGLPLAASVMAATLASFVLHTGIVVWVFSTGSATRAWLWLGAWSALMAGALAVLRALG
ncbi:hypothetical protein G6F62_014646 [Rhizopus arrhizus]|nr:hypothetical protein G6F62_014646 [Rhizopus arrhizus]